MVDTRVTINARRQLRHRAGFTLVELLAVIGIIGLLIGILVPALSAARRGAKEMATEATISALGTGVDRFKNEMAGAYPPSAAYDNTYQRTGVLNPISSASNSDFESEEITGATLLVWALAGADYLGSPGFPDRWYANCGEDVGDGGLYELDGNGPKTARNEKLVEINSMKLPEFINGLFLIPDAPGRRMSDAQPQTELKGAFFLDQFNQPILYMRARKGASNTVNSGYGAVFDMLDNAIFTGDETNNIPGYEFQPGVTHPVANGGTMATFLTNPKSPIGRPYREDSYILWSAGADGQFGSKDDLKNF